MMGYWRKFLVSGMVALGLAGMATASVGAEPRDTLLAFDSMTPIGAGAPTARGLAGGGLPWMITSGSGTVDRQGHVDVTVHGLVLAAGPKIGTNPITDFAATVSCVTPHGIMNVTTAGAPASSSGDSTIDAIVALPHPCKSPEVFVGGLFSGQFRWFAVSNVEEDDD